MKSIRNSRTVVVVAVLSVVTLVGGRVWAAPAVVTVFEATAREAPKRDAARAKAFPEGAELSVSEEVRDGWRQVRLAEGKTAFVRDDEIRLVAVPVNSGAPAKAPSQVLYVKNLSHLAELVKEDSAVQPLAGNLARRETAGYAVMFGGIAAGALITILAMTLTKDDCKPTEDCFDHQLVGISSGLGVMLLSFGAGRLILPSRGDLLGVLNEWNGRHADRPFTLDYRPGLIY